MARPLRIEYPHAVYHITSRGNEKKDIFIDDKDRLIFFEILNNVREKYNWICHSYCLMNNHYHLVIETPDANLSIGMRQLNGVYTQKFNKRHNRIGHLFQGRYKAILIQKDSHLLEVCRYVVLNPVRAKISNIPEDYKWSSYRATAGLDKQPEFLTTDWILAQFDNDKKRARRLYRDFVIAGIDKTKIYEYVKGQILLGEESFIKNMLQYSKKREENLEIPKGQKLADRLQLDEIFTEDIKKDRKKRDLAIYKAIYDYGYKQTEIANFLGLHYTSISRLVNKR